MQGFKTAFCSGDENIKKATDEYTALTRKYEIFVKEKQIQLSNAESTHDPRPAVAAAASGPSTAEQVTIIAAYIALTKTEIKQDTHDIQTKAAETELSLAKRVELKASIKDVKNTIEKKLFGLYRETNEGGMYLLTFSIKKFQSNNDILCLWVCISLCNNYDQKLLLKRIFSVCAICKSKG